MKPKKKQNKIIKFLKTKSGKKLINIILDLFIIAGFVTVIFNQGKISQLNEDKEYFNKLINQYNELAREYTEYRENSYVLHH